MSKKDMNILHASEKRHHPVQKRYHPAHRETRIASNPRSVLNCMNPISITFKPNLTERGASFSFELHEPYINNLQAELN